MTFFFSQCHGTLPEKEDFRYFEIFRYFLLGEIPYNKYVFGLCAIRICRMRIRVSQGTSGVRPLKCATARGRILSYARGVWTTIV